MVAFAAPQDPDTVPLSTEERATLHSHVTRLHAAAQWLRNAVTAEDGSATSAATDSILGQLRREAAELAGRYRDRGMFAHARSGPVWAAVCRFDTIAGLDHSLEPDRVADIATQLLGEIATEQGQGLTTA